MGVENFDSLWNGVKNRGFYDNLTNFNKLGEYRRHLLYDLHFQWLLSLEVWV